MNDILWFTGAVILVLIVLRVFATPGMIIIRVLANSIIGGLSLWGVNLLGGLVGFHIGLNPASAAILGTLGVPGLVGLGLVRLILG